MSDGLKDFFGGGQGGAPGVTWDGSKPPAVFKGVIVPGDVSQPDVAYTTEHASNIQQEPLYWNPKRGAKPAQITDAVDPVTGRKNEPVTQAVITLQTEYRDYEFMTDNAVERAKADERADDGLRRYFVRGSSATSTFRDALRALKSKPTCAQIVTVTLVKREANEYQGKTNIVETKVEQPTEASKAVLAKYLADNADQAPDTSGPFGGSADEAPPF